MRPLRWLLRVIAAIAAVIVIYLGASVAGALVPRAPAQEPAGGTPVTIYLITTALHADFAIPVDEAVRQRFAFLGREAGMAIDHPKLAYLVFGWGSRAFYTTARTYSDIRPGPTIKAITGDDSVMHVVPAGDISKLENAYPLTLSSEGLERLMTFIEKSFQPRSSDSRYLDGAGYGFGDVFFEARGSFNILRPCNVWAARGLRAAGLTTGWWTPTTHSLMLGLRLHSAGALATPLASASSGNGFGRQP